MNKLIPILLLIAFITPPPPSSVVVVDGDVITGNHLPRYGTLCEDVTIHGSPRDESPVLYTLQSGTTVRIIEQSHNQKRDWVMIQTAEWVRLSAFCFMRR